MDLHAFIQTPIYNWVVLPLLIILARIIDVSMGTLRIVYLNRGYKVISAIIGFFEVLIWITVIGQVMKNLSNLACYFAYATGYALGTFVGLSLEEKLQIGQAVIRIITQKDSTELISYFKEQNFGLTIMEGTGSQGPVQVILTVINRRDMDQVIKIVKEFNPNAFYTIENIRTVVEGIFPQQMTTRTSRKSFLSKMFALRK